MDRHGIFECSSLHYSHQHHLTPQNLLSSTHKVQLLPPANPEHAAASALPSEQLFDFSIYLAHQPNFMIAT
ncbi:unnamed protein product [Linum tenue]|uniref:Uncharacterized protein n=1 Tax=Linum tenue TaxID=586396 RepID=A0AAV0MIF9_9ROSI|nr:unnamed protein product [Linum tenue]